MVLESGNAKLDLQSRESPDPNEKVLEREPAVIHENAPDPRTLNGYESDSDSDVELLLLDEGVSRGFEDGGGAERSPDSLKRRRDVRQEPSRKKRKSVIIDSDSESEQETTVSSTPAETEVRTSFSSSSSSSSGYSSDMGEESVEGAAAMETEPIFAAIPPEQREYFQEFLNSTECQGAARDYQFDRLCQYVNGNKRHALFHMATGTGKSFMGIAMSKGLLTPGKKALVLVPTNALEDQTVDSYKEFSPDLNVQKYSDKCNVANHDVTVMTYQMLQSLRRRNRKDYDNLIKQYSILHLDEAHHALSEARVQIVEDFKKQGTSVLCYTATPTFTTKERKGGLSSVYDLLDYRKHDDNPITPYTIKQGVEGGNLAPQRSIRVIPQLTVRNRRTLLQIQKDNAGREINENKLRDVLNSDNLNNIPVQLWANWQDRETGDRLFGKQAIVFAAGINHAEAVKDAFQKRFQRYLDPDAMLEHCLDRLETTHKKKHRSFDRDAERSRLKPPGARFVLSASLAINERFVDRMVELDPSFKADPERAEAKAMTGKLNQLRDQYMGRMKSYCKEHHLPFNAYEEKRAFTVAAAIHGGVTTVTLKDRAKTKALKEGRYQGNELTEKEMDYLRETGKIKTSTPLSAADKERILLRYRMGGILVLTGANMLREGFNNPATSVCFDMTPRRSLIDKVQGCGRPGRLHPDDPQMPAWIFEWDLGIKGARFMSDLYRGMQCGTTTRRVAENMPRIRVVGVSRHELADQETAFLILPEKLSGGKGRILMGFKPKTDHEERVHENCLSLVGHLEKLNDLMAGFADKLGETEKVAIKKAKAPANVKKQLKVSKEEAASINEQEDEAADDMQMEAAQAQEAYEPPVTRSMSAFMKTTLDIAHETNAKLQELRKMLQECAEREGDKTDGPEPGSSDHIRHSQSAAVGPKSDAQEMAEMVRKIEALEGEMKGLLAGFLGNSQSRRRGVSASGSASGDVDEGTKEEMVAQLGSVVQSIATIQTAFEQQQGSLLAHIKEERHQRKAQIDKRKRQQHNLNSAREIANSGNIDAIQQLAYYHFPAAFFPVHGSEDNREWLDNNFPELQQQDYRESKYWFEKGAEGGDAFCQFHLGLMHQYGFGGKKDFVKAVELYKKASDQGYALAQNHLATLYMISPDIHGLATSVRCRRAYDLFKTAADQGYLKAMVNIGMMYQYEAIKSDHDDGTILSEDDRDSKAYQWYKKALEQGSEQANYYIGKLYFYNRVGQNSSAAEHDQQAYEFFQKAFAAKHFNAGDDLGYLIASGRVEKELTHEQRVDKVISFMTEKQQQQPDIQEVVSKSTVKQAGDGDIPEVASSYSNWFGEFHVSQYIQEARDGSFYTMRRLDNHYRELEANLSKVTKDSSPDEMRHLENYYRFGTEVNLKFLNKEQEHDIQYAREHFPPLLVADPEKADYWKNLREQKAREQQQQQDDQQRRDTNLQEEQAKAESGNMPSQEFLATYYKLGTEVYTSLLDEPQAAHIERARRDLPPLATPDLALAENWENKWTDDSNISVTMPVIFPTETMWRLEDEDVGPGFEQWLESLFSESAANPLPPMQEVDSSFQDQGDQRMTSPPTQLDRENDLVGEEELETLWQDMLAEQGLNQGYFR